MKNSIMQNQQTDLKTATDNYLKKVTEVVKNPELQTDEILKSAAKGLKELRELAEKKLAEIS